MSNFLYIYEYTVYLGLKLLIINIVFAYCLAFLYGSTCLMTAFNILPEQVTHVLSPVLSHLTCKIIHTVHDPDRLSSLSLYTLSRLVASCRSPVLQNKWNVTQEVMWEAVTRGAWWPTGDYSGKEAEHTVWPSRNEWGRPLISAPLPMRANSSQLLPSQPLLQIDSGPQVLLTASLSLSPSTLNPIRFPTDEDHTHSHRGNGQACALITSFIL